MNKKSLEKLIEKNYINTLHRCYEYGLDANIRNSDPTRSVSAQTFLLEKTNKSILMYSRGFKAHTFSNQKVIDSFKSMVDRVINKNENNDEPIIKAIIKENEDVFFDHIKKNGFFDTVNQLYDNYSKEILSLIFVSPDDTIDTSIDINVENDLIHINDIDKKNVHYKDINTFQIFDSQFLRVREDTFKNHSSRAIINLGLPCSQISKAMTLFHSLVPVDAKYKDFQQF